MEWLFPGRQSVTEGEESWPLVSQRHQHQNCSGVSGAGASHPVAGASRAEAACLLCSRSSTRATPATTYVVGCGVDCHAMNFQPFGVFVQALRNTSLRLRGWPLISASMAARPVTRAVSPTRRTLRSLQAALLYFVFPERREASHVTLVSVSPEEWVYRSSSWSIASSAAKSPLHIAA